MDRIPKEDGAMRAILGELRRELWEKARNSPNTMLGGCIDKVDELLRISSPNTRVPETESARDRFVREVAELKDVPASAGICSFDPKGMLETIIEQAKELRASPETESGDGATTRGQLDQAAPSEWRTMESAPRDGARVLAFAPHGPDPEGPPVYEIDRWQKQYNGFGKFNPVHWPPTHWMPLPTPPRAAPTSLPASPKQENSDASCEGECLTTPRDEATEGVKVPDGWVLVPVEITQEMAIALDLAPSGSGTLAEYWQPSYRAMLAASPSTPGGK